jgi:CheY-like chemotaxis protein
LAADKGLRFVINVDPKLPEAVRTDEKRLQQVVLNLLSNAFKFTAEGEVRLDFRAEKGSHNGVTRQIEGLAIMVTDTGIGIPEEKQKLIFEAFQQADGTTSRKYGGTGLGLSISREIARLLGGELRVESTPSKGSTFTLVVPFEGPQPVALTRALPSMSADAGDLESPAIAFADDRDNIDPGDRVVLIVEDDQTFGEILLGIARSVGLKGVLSNAGSGTVALARKLMPDAITLDLGLSDIDGWVLFDLLRHDRKTHSIPVHIISGADKIDALSDKGAASVLTKPVSPDDLTNVFGEIRETKGRTQRNVLIADPDANRRLELVDAVRDGNTAVTAIAHLPANTDAAALDQYDAIVIGFGRSQKENSQLAAELGGILGEAIAKLVVIAPKSLSAILGRNGHLGSVRHADNPGQLAAMVSDILPATTTELDEDNAPQDVSNLAGAKVLIVDDDIRNIYSLTSVLETYGIDVVHAERGRDGIALLEQNRDIDVALIDIMMPEMDGYETMREIRRRPGFRELPLISVTAKAMKGDRQKCLEAGASDYIAKPVDLDLLMALLRVWIGRRKGVPITGRDIDRSGITGL